MSMVPRPVPAGDGDPVLDGARRRYGDGLAELIVPLRCHIYLRVSSPEQDSDRGPDGRRIRRSVDDRDRDVLRSLDTQEREARAYAERMGWTVVAVYRETYTGTEFWTRPELRRLREQVALGAVDVMLCYKVDRFAREQTQLGVMLNLLKQHGARLEFVLDRVDDTPTGKFLLNALAFAAELEAEAIKERFSRGRMARLEAGRPLHGPTAPYGTEWADDGTRYRFLPPDSPQWGVLRSAFLEISAGASLGGICKALTRRRIPAPAGGATWYPKTLTDLLTNPLYCGEPASLRYRTEKQQVGERMLRRRHATPAGAGPELTAPEGQPPVTRAEFDTAQAAMRAAGERQRGRRGSRQTRRDDWPLLGGIAVCARCGGPLTMHSVRPRKSAATPAPERRPVYTCAANRFGAKRCDHPVAIMRDKLDGEVWLRLLALLSQPAEVERVLRAYRDTGAPSDADRMLAEAARRSIRATLADLDAESRNLAEEISRTADAYARSVLAGTLAEKGRQQERLLAELATAEATLASVEEALAELADFESQTRRLLALMSEPDGVRRLFPLAVALFRPRVVVHPQNPADPERPALSKGPRLIEVTFPAAVPAAVRGLLAAQTDGVASSGTHRSRYVPLADTPPTLRLAVTPAGALSLIRSVPAPGVPLPNGARALA